MHDVPPTNRHQQNEERLRELARKIETRANEWRVRAMPDVPEELGAVLNDLAVLLSAPRPIVEVSLQLLRQVPLTGPKGLLWRYGQLQCGPGRNLREALPLFGRLGGVPVRVFLQAHLGRFAAEAHRAAVLTIRAAIAQAQVRACWKKRANLAAARYQQAIAPAGSPDVGRAMVEMAIHWLRSPPNGAPVGQSAPDPSESPTSSAGSWILLANKLGDLDFSKGAVRFHVATVAGDASSLFPDPIRLGWQRPADDFLASLADAYQFIAKHWPSSPGMALSWWIDWPPGLVAISGKSGGLAMALAMRAAVEKVTLDPHVAATATLSADGTLGPVDGARAKQAAAAKVGCSQLLLHPATGSSTPAAAGADLVRIARVAAFEQAWNLTTYRMRGLETFVAAESSDVFNRLRIRPPRLERVSNSSIDSSPDSFALLESVAVPFRVRTKVEVPIDDSQALARERARSRGQLDQPTPFDPGPSRRGPPSPEAIERTRTVVETRPLAAEFSQWLAGPQNVLEVLGDPGYGKSLLSGLLSLAGHKAYLQAANSIVVDGQTTAAPHAALTIGRGDSLEHALRSIAPEQRLLPLRVACRQLGDELNRNGRDTSLADAVVTILERRLRDHQTGQRIEADVGGFLDMVRSAFAQRRVLLVIDGWDERPLGDWRLVAGLQSWAHDGRRLVLTSRTVNYTPGMFDPSRAVQWQLMHLDERDGVYELVRRAYGPQNLRGQDLLHRLGELPQVVSLMSVPLLGAIVCWLWCRRTELQLPAQRTDLLRLAIHDLIGSGRRAANDNDSARVLNAAPENLSQRMMLLLAKLAYETFDGERWGLKELDLRRALREPPAIVGHLGDVDAIFDALTGRFGIFTIAGMDDFEVIHQSLAEWLCAYWIVEGECRDRRGQIDAARLRAWLEDHAGIRLLDPRWQEVWCYLGGMLRDDVVPLLDDLRKTHNRKRPGQRGVLLEPPDDIFDSALCMAGHVLAASGLMSGPAQKEMPKGHVASWVVARLLTKWRNMRSRGVDYVQTNAAIITLGRVVPLVVNELRSDLRREDNSTQPNAVLRYHAALALRELRFRATRALWELGAVAAPAVPDLIYALRHDTDDIVRASAAWTLVKLGAVAAPAVPDLIHVLRHDTGDSERASVAWALGELGAVAALAVPDLILVLRHNVDPELRRSAASALGKLGAVAALAVPDLVHALRHDTDILVRACAVQALGELGAVAAPAVPDLILFLRQNVDPELWRSAAQALWELGAVAGPAVPDLVHALRHDTDYFVKGFAARALEKLGAVAAPAVPDLIHALRHDTDDYVRASAASALGELGAVAALAVPDLVHSLRHDTGDSVRESAAQALWKLGAVAATAVPDLVHALRHDTNASVRECVVKALGELGAVAALAVPDLIHALRHDTGHYVRASAAQALGELGAVAAPAVPDLIHALRHDTDASARALAARTLLSISMTDRLVFFDKLAPQSLETLPFASSECMTNRGVL